MIPHVNDSKNDIDNESKEFDSKAKEIPWFDRILLDRPSKVIFAAVILAIVLPILFYHFFYYQSIDVPPADGFSVGSCLIARTARLPCGDVNANVSECHSQCCFDLHNNLCFHRFPSRLTYISEDEWNEETVFRPRINTVPYNNQPSLKEITLSIDEITPTHLSVTFYDPRKLTLKGRRIERKNYTYQVSRPELNVAIDDSFGNNIFNTVRGPIIASENIWEISFKLTDEFIYGLGEIPLVHNTTKVLHSNKDGLSSIPLIFAKTNGTFHGLLINTEPAEVQIVGENQIVVRSITNISMQFHIFTGPTPQDITRDVMEMVGFKNDLKYWMLGAHICSENSILSEGESNLREMLSQISKEKLPFDSHCGINPIVFDNKQCEENSYKNDIETGARLVRDYNKRFVPHISPYIRYQEPNMTSENSTEKLFTGDLNCTDILPEFEAGMLRTSDSNFIYKGIVGEHFVVYPDYENVQNNELINKLWTKIKIDGVVLENNWPLDESLKPHNETRYLLPYFSKTFERAFNHTPQWNITKVNGDKYIYFHNQYGNHFVKAFRNISEDNIPIWSSSQRLTSDIVNRQNINTTWADLQKELTEAALGGISGHRLWSSPVCGDTEYYNNITHINLCIKWYMAATYLPLIKIHSKNVRRDPLSFTGSNKLNIVTALNRRQSLLPYFYTTLQNGPLLRPMFYQFPDSEKLANLKSQFSVGEDLLIVPNLLPSQSHVHVIMPPGDWYELWSGVYIDNDEGETVTMTTTEADFLTFVRGGSVIVMQKNSQETAEQTRLRSEYSLTIALQCKTVNNSNSNTTDSTEILSNTTETICNSTECYAKGSLYMTEKMTINFVANSETLNITASGDNYAVFCDLVEGEWASRIQEIYVYGLDATVNNYDHHKYIRTTIDMCELQMREEIVFQI